MDKLQSCEIMQGLLSSLSLRDLTPAGVLYPLVFSTVGKKALEMRFLKFADTAHVDPSMEQFGPEPCRAFFSMNMSSVQYIHTRRFQTMLVAYINQFQQMQAFLKRFRAAAAGMIAKVESSPNFFHLDINIDQPLIIVPRNSFSADFFQANLGNLKVSNVLQVRTYLQAHRSSFCQGRLVCR
jgi:hypothetical protein